MESLPSLSAEQTEERLRLIRSTLEKRLPRACGCSHETRFANVKDLLPYEIAFSASICPPGMRKGNPLCAHALGVGTFPNPYKTEIMELMNLGILGEEWLKQSHETAMDILQIDSDAGIQARAGEPNEAKAKARQKPLEDRLLAMREELLRIIDERLQA